MSDFDEWRLDFGPAFRTDISVEVEDVIRANGVELILRMNVRARGGLGDEFTGSSHCSIFGPELARFIVELDALERTRRGEATLSTMFTEELKLTFRSIDHAGQIAVHAAISGRVWTRHECIQNHVATEVEIDSSLLPDYLASFRALAQYFDSSAPAQSASKQFDVP
jgi:hypothetical protein